MNNIPTPQSCLKQSKDTFISYYKSLTDKECKKITIGDFLELVRSNTTIKDKVCKLRQEDNKQTRDVLKKSLPAVTISGLFGTSRTSQNLIEHSGFLQLDFDNVPELEIKLQELKKDVYSFAVFLSPSGTGIKVIVKVIPDKTKHFKSFIQLQTYYKETFSLVVDAQCKDVSRLMFLSWDENLYVNENSSEWIVKQNESELLFNELLIEFEKSNHFIEGKRNDFVFKLARECCNKNVIIGYAFGGICAKYESESFTQREINKTIMSAYNYRPQNENHLHSNNNNSKNDESKNQSYSLLKRVEIYIEKKYDIRLNQVSGKLEYKLKEDSEIYKDLNENNLFIELQHANLPISMQKLSCLFQSDFVKSYDPFKAYFDSLGIWQNEPDYIENLCGYIPAIDTARFKTQFKKMLVRCIACALEPNVFNKQVFVLVGEGQNTGKSTFCRWLCPPTLSNYFTECMSTDKDGKIALSTNFFINMDELATLSKSEINSLKSFISTDRVVARIPFDKRSSSIIRRANFIGSTNNDEFLADETGSVRWLCFKIDGRINFDYKKDIDINSVWKQAYTLYKDSFHYQLSNDEIKENEIANSEFTIDTLEAQLIKKYYKPSDKANGKFVDASDIMEYIISRNNHAKLNVRSIGKAMKFLGFKKSSNYDSSFGYSTKGYYVIEIIK
jgi:predicted P-loop ATPase